MDTDEAQMFSDGRDGDDGGGPPREWILGRLFLVRQCLCLYLQHICAYLCLICVHLWLKILSPHSNSNLALPYHSRVRNMSVYDVNSDENC
ncbi:hypothetical protein IAD21_04357 [Abditibacteriota bacterium]|nr:hypothetical protein IAD21_04357 [Abditibacteriota bacterium]